MKELWKALLARLVYWLTPKRDEVLLPGICQCGHRRCNHKKGKLDCCVSLGLGYGCCCEIYIPSKDRGDDDIHTPSPADLERLYQK